MQPVTGDVKPGLIQPTINLIMTLREILADPGISSWLKDAIKAAYERDPIEAMRDARRFSPCSANGTPKQLTVILRTVFRRPPFGTSEHPVYRLDQISVPEAACEIFRYLLLSQGRPERLPMEILYFYRKMGVYPLNDINPDNVDQWIIYVKNVNWGRRL